MAVASPRGVCRVTIGDGPSLISQTLAGYPSAATVRDDGVMGDVMHALSGITRGVPAPDMPTDVHGTDFQISVWKTLRTIPVGETWTYSQVATAVGRPRAVRAAASACGANPTALIVPCHRVIRSDGTLGGYYWGLAVKESLLAAETNPI